MLPCNDTTNLIVNDMLCFIQNNVMTLGIAAIVRLCKETYSCNEIEEAVFTLNDFIQQSNPALTIDILELSSPLDNEAAITSIVHLLRKSDNVTFPQFVSTGSRLPRYGVYRDALSSACLWDEINELKQVINKQHEFLCSEIHTLYTALVTTRNCEQQTPVERNGHYKESSSLVRPNVNPTLMQTLSNNNSMESSPHVDNHQSSAGEHFATQSNYSTFVSEEIHKAPKKLKNIRKVKPRKKRACEAGGMVDVIKHKSAHNDFSCPICNYRFSHPDNMVKHMTEMHQISCSSTMKSKGKKFEMCIKPSEHKKTVAHSSVTNTTDAEYDEVRVMLYQPDSDAVDSSIYSSNQMHPDELEQQVLISNSIDEALDIDKECPPDLYIAQDTVKEEILPEIVNFSTNEAEIVMKSKLLCNTESWDRINSDDSNKNEESLDLPSSSLTAAVNYAAPDSLSTSLRQELNQSGASTKSTSSRSYSARIRHLKKCSCSICGYTSSSRSDVIRHIRKHTGEQPFSCSLCDRRFTLRGNMVKHVARVHKSALKG